MKSLSTIYLAIPDAGLTRGLRGRLEDGGYRVQEAMNFGLIAEEVELSRPGLVVLSADLPGLEPASVDVPTLVAPGATITVTATISGSPAPGTNPLVSYGYSGGFGATLGMTDQGGGVWTADLPAASCSDQPQLYITYFDLVCGQLTVPSNAPTDFFTIHPPSTTDGINLSRACRNASSPLAKRCTRRAKAAVACLPLLSRPLSSSCRSK